MEKQLSDDKDLPFASVLTCFRAFLRLGLISFGGPVAHIGYFREEFVMRRKWLSDQAYADIVALCQFLPGPASSQVGFAIGYLRAGLTGAFASWLAFTLPSAIIMIGCAYGIAYVNPDSSWLHGLKIAAVAVVAHAVWGMAGKLCPDRERAMIAIVSAGAVLAVKIVWIQVGAIALGMILGSMLFRSSAEPIDTNEARSYARIQTGIIPVVCLIAVLTGFIMLPVATAIHGGRGMEILDGFYRSGLLVFGGGHVVLPLLEMETVGHGWLDRDSFLAGYGAAQALPGPLFTLAAYLGTLAAPSTPAWLWGLVALAAILLPPMLLVVATLPGWDRLRNNRSARAAMMGANAAVVGILLAALYDPVFLTGITSARAMIIALFAFASLHFWRVPSWTVVIASAALGATLL